VFFIGYDLLQGKQAKTQMGLILAVIAVQMLINGHFNVIKEFPR
jgi:hypothetical protein